MYLNETANNCIRVYSPVINAEFLPSLTQQSQISIVSVDFSVT